MYENQREKAGKAIRRLREREGFAQEEFAQFAGIDRANYGKIERGEHNLTLITLFKIAGNLRVSPSELLADITAEECIAERTVSR